MGMHSKAVLHLRNSAVAVERGEGGGLIRFPSFCLLA